MQLTDFLGDKKISQACQHLREQGIREAKIAIILGSFLNKTPFYLPLSNKKEIDAEKIPSFPVPSVPGHQKKIIFGNIMNQSVLIFAGRCHYYEGYSMQKLVYPVVMAKKLGAKAIIITNSAGGLNRFLNIDNLMVIEDHINFMFDNPLFGFRYDKKRDYFLDMNSAYNKALLKKALACGKKAGIGLKRGTYVGIKGPLLETRAEAEMFKAFGGDAIGMSTIPETIIANFLKIKVLGISHIRNMVYDNKGKHNVFNHFDGVNKEELIGKKLAKLIEKILEKE
ncbi:MAG: purine-nucleoside phosphorylase [Candidatus Humimicrobiaceae bacterium]